MKEVEEARCRDQQRRAKLRAEPESFATWATKEDENRKSKRIAKDAEYTQKELEKIDEEKRLVTEDYVQVKGTKRSKRLYCYMNVKGI